MKAATNYHDAEWRIFAHEMRLSMQRDSNGFYISTKTRVSHAAWVRRSEIEGSADGPKAYFNSAMQLASSLAYDSLISLDKELATNVAKAIQALRIDNHPK